MSATERRIISSEFCLSQDPAVIITAGFCDISLPAGAAADSAVEGGIRGGWRTIRRLWRTPDAQCPKNVQESLVLLAGHSTIRAAPQAFRGGSPAPVFW